MERYEYRKGSSSKFWEIATRAARLSVRWGRIGSDGQSKTSKFSSAAAAEEAADKLRQQKMAKGYVLVGSRRNPQGQEQALRGPEIAWTAITQHVAKRGAELLAAFAKRAPDRKITNLALYHYIFDDAPAVRFLVDYETDDETELGELDGAAWTSHKRQIEVSLKRAEREPTATGPKPKGRIPEWKKVEMSLAGKTNAALDRIRDQWQLALADAAKMIANSRKLGKRVLVIDEYGVELHKSEAARLRRRKQ